MAISYLVYTDNMAVLRFRNKRSQLAAWGEDEGAIRVSAKTAEEDLGVLNMEQLTAIYNQSVDESEQKSKFKNKALALEAAVGALDAAAEDGPNIDAPEGGAGPRGRKSIFFGKRIWRNVEGDENPRREGSWGAKAWDLIEDGMTFEAYMEAVDKAGIPGGSKHLRYDFDQGRITAE